MFSGGCGSQNTKTPPEEDTKQTSEDMNLGMNVVFSDTLLPSFLIIPSSFVMAYEL